MIVEAFRPFHVDLLRAQGVQQAQLGEISHVPATYETVLPGLTAREGDRIVMCGGITHYAPQRGICWALVSQDAGRHMLFLTRAVRRFIGTYPWRRLEATVEETFAPGCRWVELLGFEFEGRMRGYGMNGETYLRYGWAA